MNTHQERPYGIVYRVNCVPSGKSYVGQTVRPLSVRWKAHKYNQEGCRALKAAIEKYRAEAFTIEVIDTATSQEELNAKEIHWIGVLGTMSPGGYNLTAGGKGPGIPSPETRGKMRQAKLAVAHTDEFKQLMSAAGKANTGRPKSPEHVVAAAKALAEARVHNGGRFKRVCLKPRADKGVPRSLEVKARMKLARALRSKAHQQAVGVLSLIHI